MNGCWLWIGATNGRGYGVIARGGDSNGVPPLYAHRVMYAVAHGFDPIKMQRQVRHSCDNPPCCNPKHLLGGTAKDNNRDTARRGHAHWQWATRDAHGRFMCADTLQK